MLSATVAPSNNLLRLALVGADPDFLPIHNAQLSVKEPAILNASQRRINDKRAHLQTA